jgi:hypothetical protein
VTERLDDPPAARVRAERHRVAEQVDHHGRARRSRRAGCARDHEREAMMPIVFCASFVPCVNATKPPETSWSLLNQRFTAAGERLRMIHVIVTSEQRAAKPSSGAAIEG